MFWKSLTSISDRPSGDDNRNQGDAGEGDSKPRGDPATLPVNDFSEVYISNKGQQPLHLETRFAERRENDGPPHGVTRIGRRLPP
jgi:hypothetical protein